MVYQPEGSKAKKLIGAAEYWASGGDTKELDADAAAFNVTIESEEPKHYEVDPDNWPAVQMFLRLQTQWRVGTAGVIGLDYSVIQWLFSLYPVKDPCAVLEDLQVMEAAVLKLQGEAG